MGVEGGSIRVTQLMALHKLCKTMRSTLLIKQG